MAILIDPVAEQPATYQFELVDANGKGRSVLIVREYGNGWLIVSTEQCVDGNLTRGAFRQLSRLTRL